MRSFLNKSLSEVQPDGINLFLVVSKFNFCTLARVNHVGTQKETERRARIYDVI